MTTGTLKKIYHMGDEFTIEGGHDYSWETKTISSGAVTLGLRTIVEPTSNFTLNIPSPLEDGMEYVLRCVNGSTAYTLTLGTGFVNDFNVDLTLHANASDQFTFVSVDGNLELQPEYALSDNGIPEGGTEGQVLTKTSSGVDWCDASGGGEKQGYIDFLMVGGGGGGAGGEFGYGGGGGGGFIEKSCQTIYSRPYNVTIGGGGNVGTKGGNTVFYGIAYGGGSGPNVCNGASGGGGSNPGGYWYGEAVHGTQGNRGGSHCSCMAGGGGGGALCPGCNATANCYGANGGSGKSSSISGTLQWYAGGGGGSGRCGSGAGGCGGGGNGGRYNYAACNATYYGGGGGGGSNMSGNGCQGIVIVRYPSNGCYGFSCATGGDCCYTCNGYCVHIFTTDGIFTPLF